MVICHCRVYFDADLDESYTSPGEWPWAVLIFNDGVYIGGSVVTRSLEL